MQIKRWSGWFMAIVAISLVGCESARENYSRDGSSPDRATVQMNELIDQSVKDPAKASRVKSLTREIVNEAKQSYAQRREADRRLYQLNANYNATPEEFTKILDDINNAHMRSSAKILGLRFKIKDQVTPEEWRALTEGMKKYGDRYLGGPGVQ